MTPLAAGFTPSGTAITLRSFFSGQPVTRHLVRPFDPMRRVAKATSGHGGREGRCPAR
jgi:hypothetical protein